MAPCTQQDYPKLYLIAGWPCEGLLGRQALQRQARGNNDCKGCVLWAYRASSTGRTICIIERLF